MTLISFVAILWGLSSSSPARDRIAVLQIPGYLVWAALIYAILGTWVTHLVGRPLIKLNFDQQRYEADFRFSLVRLRENAEEVTLSPASPPRRSACSTASAAWSAFGTASCSAPSGSPSCRGYSQIADHLPVHRSEPALFLRLDDARRADADRVRLRPGAGRAVLLCQGLLRDRRLEGRAEPARGFDASMDWAKGLDTAAPRVNHVSDGGTAMAAAAPRPSACRTARRSCALRASRSRRRARAGHRSFGIRQDEPVPRAWRRVALRRRHHPHPEGAKLLVLPQKPYLPLGTLRGALLSGAAGRFLAGGDRRCIARDRPRRSERGARRDRLLGRPALRGEQQRLSHRPGAPAKARLAVPRRGDRRRPTSRQRPCSIGC